MCTVVTGVPTMCFKDANLQAKGLVPPLTPAGAQRLGMWVLSLPPGDGDGRLDRRGAAHVTAGKIPQVSPRKWGISNSTNLSFYFLITNYFKSFN